MSNDVLQLKKISKSYGEGEARVEVLKDVSLSIGEGESVALVGPSGSGKTTLLQIAGLLDAPDDGDILLSGETVSLSNDDKVTALRSRAIGFVYQAHHLLAEFSALENVMLPQLIAGKSHDVARGKAMELLERVGLKERVAHRPGELSGGERQRVAMARALANDPLLLLADEPTGNLDSETAATVYALLMEIISEKKLAMLMATHNTTLAKKLTRTVTMKNGALTEKKR